MAPTLPFTALDAVEVFAVEDRVAQLVWRGLPDGIVGARIDDRELVLGEGGRPGAGEITGLEPDTDHTIDITLDDRVVARRRFRTTAALAGPALTRIATISDLHLGEEGFGLLKDIREPGRPDRGYPLRCAQAAAAEATAWGADLLVIKGDITDYGQPAHWEQFDELLATIDIPVIAIPGNHDTFQKPGSLDATEQLQKRGLFDDEIQALDLPGVRVIAADTTTPRHTWGRIRHIAEPLCATVDTDDPVLLLLHHHLETHPYPRIWPLGTPKRQAATALDALAATNPDLFLSSGHTHRNRSRTHGPVRLTEVGATKDHPGVWAGYVAHETGIRQVVRRVAEPSCLAWNDRTHAAVGGIWGRWSPGRIESRSFTHPWSRAGSSRAGSSRAVSSRAGSSRAVSSPRETAAATLEA